jgi:hypothetical protein
MVLSRVVRAPHERQQIPAKRDGVIGAQMHFIAPGIAPRLEYGEVAADNRVSHRHLLGNRSSHDAGSLLASERGRDTIMCDTTQEP